MLRVLIDFPKAMVARLAGPWVAWVGLLFVINAVAPLFFLETLEARIVLGALLLSALAMMAIFQRMGFVRLLGLGHAPWLIMVPWLLARADFGGLDSAFDYWLWSIIVLNTISLVVDVVDVSRFIRGDRAPLSG